MMVFLVFKRVIRKAVEMLGTRNGADGSTGDNNQF